MRTNENPTQPVRADLDLGLVLDIDCRIASKPRSHEQRDIVAPRNPSSAFSRRY